MSDFLKALSAITSSLQQGAPHLRALETIAEDVASVVSPAAAVAVGQVTGAIDAVVDTAQQTLGAVAPTPVSPNLAMAIEVTNTVASAIVAAPAPVSSSVNGNVTVAAPSPAAVVGAVIDTVPVVPELPNVGTAPVSSVAPVDAVALAASTAAEVGNVNPSALAAGGAASQAATSDQLINRLMTVETALNAILPLIADYAKQRGL